VTVTTDKPDPLIGVRLGDYLIQSLIGRGGMAQVYEGLDEKLGRRAAIKVMELQHDHSDEMTQRFIREARAIASLDHPGIISLYQFGEGPDLYYMAMKFVDGQTLLSILKRLRQQKKFMEPDRIVAIIDDIASALDYAHAHNVVHRDIKPSNIMLTDEGRGVLTDFGLTMQLGSDSTLGTAFGTPRYIAPEQAISSQRSVPQSDIYSLGVVLYEMATGQAPFDNDSPMSLALSHITSVPPMPQSIRPDVPHPVQMVILKALEKRPENRWQTATALANALRDAYNGIDPNIVLSQEPLDAPPMMPEVELEPVPSALPALIDHTALIPASALPQRVPRFRRRLVSPYALLGLVVLVGTILGGIVLYGAMTTARPIPSLAAIQPAPTVEARVRLIYTKDTFAIYNATGQQISLENVSFVRSDPSGRPLEAAIFGDKLHKQLPTGQCLQIRMRSSDERSLPLVCGPQTKPRIYEDPAIIFWAMRSDNDPVTTFQVNRRGRTLQTCSMRLNTCEFSLLNN
jgi:serine/threonine protein kinase